MNERARRILRGFVVLGDIALLIFIFVLFIKENISRGYDIDKEEFGFFLLIIGWIIVNIIALCDMPKGKESWLALTLKRRKLEQQAMIKDFEERLKKQEDGNNES